MNRRWLWVLIGLLGTLVPSQAAAQCGVYKTYAEHEVLLHADLNSSFQRTVDANSATCVDDYSTSTTQMRATADPYPGSAESLATTLAGELERIRYQLNALIGKTYWYQPADNAMAKDVAKHWGATFTKYTEIADPTTPATNNEAVLYAKDDGAGVTILAYKDSAGNVTALTGASSSFGNSLTSNFLSLPNAGTPTTKVDVSWDRLSIEGYVSTSFTGTIDTSTTGALALDTGTLGNSTGYYVWAIFNPTAATASVLASASESAPTMPSGYTKKRNVGFFRTNASAQIIGYRQVNQVFVYKPNTTTAALVKAVTAGAAVTATSFDLGTTSGSDLVPQTRIEGVWFVVNPLSAGHQTYLHWESFSTVNAENVWGIVYDSALFDTLSTAPRNFYVPAMNPTAASTYFYAVAANTSDIYVWGFTMLWK